MAKKDMYGQTGAEYDFVANIRTEQLVAIIKPGKFQV